MLNKLFALTIFAATTAAAVSAQETPVAPTEGRTVQRMAFAIPFEGSYLGVQTENISKENFSKYRLTTVRGVGVDKVVENSPAAKAGLRKGDVIVKFEGEEVSSVNKLTRLISEVAPDHTASLTVVRDGGEREISVTLGKREFSPFQGGNFRFENMTPLTPVTPMTPVVPLTSRTMPTAPFPSFGGGDSNDVFVWRSGTSRQIGIGVTPLTKQLGDFFGVAEGKGLLINSVRENSPAAKAGLKAGDVVIEIDGKEAKTMADLIRAINEKNEGGISLTFVRDKNRQTVSVTPETVKPEKMKPEEMEKIFGEDSSQSSDN